MLNPQDNELLCRVGPGQPMHDLAKLYWMPALRSEMLKPGGKPERVRLLGENYVAFRGDDGRVGFFDEACPHRGVSLALARNEDCALTCIFHGWKFGVDGEVKVTPSEPAATREAFRKRVKFRTFRTHEAGGAVWVFLGDQQKVPSFPDFEFNTLPAENVIAARGIMHCNWLQGVEAVLDSAHVGLLHAGQIAGVSEDKTAIAELEMTMEAAPTFEMVRTPYGFREGALRALPDGSTYARIREVVLPFFSFIPTYPGVPNTMIASFPIDDEWCAQWYWNYDTQGPIEGKLPPQVLPGELGGTLDNFCEGMGGWENMWGQDREAMKTHWTGLPGPLPWEDFIVEEAMGPIVDRTKENLGTSDVIIMSTRRILLEMLNDLKAGRQPECTVQGFDAAKIRGVSLRYRGQLKWTEIDPAKPPKELMPLPA